MIRYHFEVKSVPWLSMMYISIISPIYDCMAPREVAYQKILELIERFSEQHSRYKRTDYNETLTRRDFIDPFFKALGWDVDNENGYAESYREVIHEDRVKVGKATRLLIILFDFRGVNAFSLLKPKSLVW